MRIERDAVTYTDIVRIERDAVIYPLIEHGQTSAKKVFLPG